MDAFTFSGSKDFQMLPLQDSKDLQSIPSIVAGLWDISQFKENQSNEYVGTQIKQSNTDHTLNSEEVAWSQPIISEFLSDNVNKDKTRPSAPASPDVKKYQI